MLAWTIVSTITAEKNPVQHITNVYCTCNPVQNNTSHQENRSSFWQSLSLPLLKVPDAVSKKLPNVPQLSELSAMQIKQISVLLIKKYKYKISFSTLFSLYAITCFLVIRGNQYLDAEHTWAAFKAELSFTDLIQIPHQELAQELLKEIQRRYTKAQNLTDFITPLIAFMNDIDKEIKKTKNYIWLYTWLQRLRIAPILPFNIKRYSQAPIKLQRLLHLKNIFLTWAAEFKIGNNTVRSTLLIKQCDTLGQSPGLKFKIKYNLKKVTRIFRRSPYNKQILRNRKKISILWAIKNK